MKQHCPKASFFPKGKGAHEGRRQWRKQAVVVEAPKGWRGEGRTEAARSAQSKAAKRLEARGAHEARALWAKQRGVSPMR